uniref:TOG domain-containing protein n=1 Tax=Oryza punctata TaxID=4537 RepID=A0A0E0L404_ORYPU
MGGGGGEDEVVARARQLPWRERMRHVSWKVRREAHLDLAAACRTIAGPADPRVHEFGPLFRYTVRDDNPEVQELALDSLLTFLPVVDPRDASSLVGRPITIEKAKTIFLMFIELHAVDIFLDSMENAVKKKVQTVVIKSVELLQKTLQQFGSDVVSAERIMKVHPELLESSDNRVRKASEVLAIELSRWIGRKALRRSVIKKIAERRKGNLSELLLDVQQMTKPKPTRMLRHVFYFYHFFC